jgi:lipopolysaccharide transport system permease protein
VPGGGLGGDRVSRLATRPVDPRPQLEEEATRVTRIEASRRWRVLSLRELWEYRELGLLFAWRDVKVRYKQTALGATWAVLQPLLTMAVFTLFFGRLGKIPSDDVPYPLFALAALVPWTFFANGLLIGANSLVQNAELITKTYFPRLLVILGVLIANLVDLVIILVVLVVAAAIFGEPPSPKLLAVPLLVLLCVAATLGVTAGLAALNVRFRDVRYVIPFLVQFWLFATPIAYPSSLLSEPWRSLLALNPMVGVVEGFRWAVLGTSTNPSGVIIVSTAASMVILVISLGYFSRVERTFADIV